MLLSRPPRKQRLITQLCGRDWFEVVLELIAKGNTLQQIASRFTANGIPVHKGTLSRWISQRVRELEREKCNAA
jgi:hypothetical protein